jgi:ABC-type Fe3+/spermidine/putrescine transport system ATPase subunit
VSGGTAAVRVAPGIVFHARTTDSIAAGGRVQVVVRPERVALLREPEKDSIAGRIVERVFSGDTVRFAVELDGGVTLRSTKPNADAYRAFRMDDRIWVRPEQCRAVQADA